MLLAIDTGIRSTGWCCGDGTTVPACGAWQFESFGDDLGALGRRFWFRLLRIHDRFHPTCVAYEAAILIHSSTDQHGNHRRDSLSFLSRRLGMDFLLETFFAQREIPVHKVGLQAMKKELTGNRHAEKTDMVAIAEKCGLRLPEKGADDAADAFAAFLCKLRDVDPKASAQWDGIVYGARGGLL